MTWSTLSYSTVHLESIDFPLFQRFSRCVSTTLSSPLSCLHRPSCINFTQVVNRKLCRRGKSSKRWCMLVYSKKDTSEADVSCLCEGGKIKMFFNLKLLNWKVKLRVGNFSLLKKMHTCTYRIVLWVPDRQLLANQPRCCEIWLLRPEIERIRCGK